MAETEVPVPPQHVNQPIYDFRAIETGPKGYKVNVTKWGNPGSKRKLDEYAEQVEREQAEMDLEEVAAAQKKIGTIKRPKHDTAGLGKASGRPWKQPNPRANTLRNPSLSSTWEKKMKDKAELNAFRTRKKEAQQVRKDALKEERLKREAAKLRKEENRKKSQVVQKISTETAKRMMKSKKQRKLLGTA